MGSSRPRNSTRARKAHSAKRSVSLPRSPKRRRPARKAPALPVEIVNAIDDQRRELATAMTLLHCLHCVLRCEADDTGPGESEAVQNAVGWVELPDVTALLLVRLHAVHLALDSVSLRHTLQATES
jgi:hypothetical protein